MSQKSFKLKILWLQILLLISLLLNFFSNKITLAISVVLSLVYIYLLYTIYQKAKDFRYLLFFGIALILSFLLISNLDSFKLLSMLLFFLFYAFSRFFLIRKIISAKVLGYKDGKLILQSDYDFFGLKEQTFSLKAKPTKKKEVLVELSFWTRKPLRVLK